MDRRAFVFGVGAAVVTPDWMQDRNKLGVSDVSRIRAVTEQIRTVDFAQGGGTALGPALAELRRVSDWPSLASGSLRTRMSGAVGELANTVGFAAFDNQDYATSRHCWSLATRCAETADDRPLWAHAMVNVARQETWIGDPDQGLPLVERVVELAPHLPANVVAMAHAVRARALAAMGDVGGTLAAVGAGDDAMDFAGGDRQHASYYDRATHLGNSGHALADLVTAGHPEVSRLASARIMGAIVGQGSPRSVVMGQVVEATVVMQTGDPAQAVGLGSVALDVSEDVDSARTRYLLWRLHDVAARHADRADVQDLRHRIQQHAA